MAATAAIAHEHAHHQGVALAGAARDALESRGEQWTDMRAAVFGTLAGAGRPTSAYDIADALSRAQGRRVAPNSIYRILDLFVASNLAQRIESANAYVANPHPGCVHDCVFLMCDGCGATLHLDDDAVAGSMRAAAKSSGFAPTRAILEMRGRCATCAAAAHA